MKALVLNALHQNLDFQEYPVRTPQKGEVRVRMSAAALNHRDIFITQGLYAGIRFPSVLGSDGVGDYRGKRVLINPSMEWGTSAAHQGKEFRVLGMPDDGTFAEQIVLPRKNLVAAPDYLSDEQAAALPLAGLTAYRAFFSRCQWKKGERVLITGVGGGVALMALQLAVAAGADVFVTSGNADKIERACALGAKGGANYKIQDWDKNLKKEARGFDVILDSAAGEGFAQLAGLCNPGARIGIYGGTAGKINGLSPQIVFWKQVSILGSSMGSPSEFRKMVAFVAQKEIVPVVDSVFPLSAGAAAFARLGSGAQFGKVVLRIE